METLESYLKSNKPKEFAPRPYYSAEGDSLTFFFQDVPYYRERIDDFLTLYRAMDGHHQLIGCQIKGLPKTLEVLGDFGVTIEAGPVQLTMIFIACAAQTTNREALQKYRELGKVAAEKRVSIPASELAPVAA